MQDLSCTSGNLFHNFRANEPIFSEPGSKCLYAGILFIKNEDLWIQTFLRACVWTENDFPQTRVLGHSFLSKPTIHVM
ncbi:hypothetical protein [Methanosarcina sp. UBA289]|uniref:hypothetical protein n=1 Tax=Methanosarcina sp. UBA289 TaxID=1915574 RepID=UPI0025F7A469|nr:hypothetical protein [Methanosarcina sp. UBA289]